MVSEFMLVHSILPMEIEKVPFIKRKYGKELLIDCTLFSQAGSALPANPFIGDYYGICIVTAGNGSTLIDNYQISFKKGSLIFFQPKQVRQWLTVSPSFDGYFLVFENEFIGTFFQDSFFIYRFQFFHNISTSYSLECEDHFLNEIVSLCEKISNELRNLQDDSHHFLRSILYNILIQINRRYVKQSNRSVDLFQNNTALQFKEMIESGIKDHTKVEDYARLLKISRAHLNNLSKKVFGLPVSAVIKGRLLTEIKRELLFTDKTVREICFTLNFSDDSNLIRFFKRYTGVSPGEYRSEYKK
jgi:AraC family transcriptional regulator, transcriptional activator of pobA